MGAGFRKSPVYQLSLCQESGDIVAPERAREILDAAVDMAERLR